MLLNFIGSHIRYQIIRKYAKFFGHSDQISL